ncbi:MAG: hypothetical protein ABFD92_09775 [Planctomycetaceae bacterium]|nr:hypothetical protein [Planctomycetaceae bacterium]
MQRNRRYPLIVLVAALGLVATGCEQQSAKIDAGDAKAPVDTPAVVVKPAPAEKPAPAVKNGAAAKRPAQAVLPEPVDKAVRTLYAKAPYHKIETAQCEGLDVYTVHVARMATKVVVTADGAILMVGRQLPLKDLPKDVAETITKTYGASTLKITKDDVRAEITKSGETASVVKVEPIRTFYEVQVIRADDAKNHKGYMRVDDKGKIMK